MYAERVLGVGRRTWSGRSSPEAALEVFTRDESPIEWARTTNNLGNAYRHRSTAGEVADLERALACYRQALAVRGLLR